jgi:hypothetical protein
LVVQVEVGGRVAMVETEVAPWVAPMGEVEDVQAGAADTATAVVAVKVEVVMTVEAKAVWVDKKVASEEMAVGGVSEHPSNIDRNCTPRLGGA